MRVLHVVHTLERKADGVASFVAELVTRQRQAGHHVEYLTGDGAPLVGLEGLAPERGSLLRRSWSAVKRFDLVHLHALWVPSTLICGHVALARGVPLVVTPHGMLDPWALQRSRLAKRLARWVGVDRLLARASAIHALCIPELEAIRALGFRAPVALVPPGIDVSEFTTERRLRPRAVVFMGRLHPKKGLDLLANGFRTLAARFPNWKLVIAGPDQVGMIPDLKARLADVEAGRVEFPGQLLGQARRDLLAGAGIFILPSHSEGLPVAVLEAMAAETPVIVTHPCNLDEIEPAGAGRVCEDNELAITAALEELMSVSDERLEEMGRAGKRLVMDRFTGAAVARELLSVYRWALADGMPPRCVHSSV